MMMRIAKKLALPLLLTIGMACFLWSKHKDAEPAFHDRKLTAWMHQLHDQSASETQHATALDAIKAMDNRGVAYLAGLAKPEQSWFRQKVRERYGMSHRFLLRWFSPAPPNPDRREAIITLGMLGPAASNGIPALEWAARQTDNLRGEARTALTGIRGETVAQWIESMENGNTKGASDVAALLAECSTNSRASIPALCQGLASTNEWVSSVCVRALGQLHADPQTSVPALAENIKRLRSAPKIQPGRVQESLFALSRFKAEARPAVPVIKQCQQDQDPQTRLAALTSLSRILEHKESKEMLATGTTDPDKAVQDTAARLLKQMNDNAEKEVPIK